MFSKNVLAKFVDAAKSLWVEGFEGVSFTSNNLRRLDFVLELEGEERSFSAIEQNPQKLSTPAQLTRQGHKIVQIRDNKSNRLIGNVDISDNAAPRFNVYTTDDIASQVDFDKIESVLGKDSTDPEDIQIGAAISSDESVTPISKKKRGVRDRHKKAA